MDNITIIGAGRVGRTLGRLWKESGVYGIECIYDRCVAGVSEAKDFIGDGKTCNSLEEVTFAKIVILAVPDGQIASCAGEISAMNIKEGTVVFHCSGYHSSQILQCLEKRGCQTASVHPVKSFADPQKAAVTFAGTPCAAEGSSEAIGCLRQAFEIIDAVFFTIHPDKKKLYHSATVFLSNYVVSLLKVGADLLGQSGVTQDQCRMVLRALCPEAVENSIENGFFNSLTGPVSRGDIETVRGELAVLRKQGDLHYQLYKLLGKTALEIAAEKSTLDKKNMENMENLFRSDDMGC